MAETTNPANLLATGLLDSVVVLAERRNPEQESALRRFLRLPNRSTR